MEQKQRQRGVEVNVEELSVQARSLWAKSGDETGFLNLPQHLIDVAGVAGVLWDSWLSTHSRQWLARKLGLDQPEVRVLLMWLAGTHDIGKATRLFQRQLEKRGDSSHSDRIADAGLSLTFQRAEMDVYVPHSTFSRAALRNWLADQGVGKSITNSLSQVAEAHHGLTSEAPVRRLAQDIIDEDDEGWTDVRREILEAVADFTGAVPVLRSLKKRLNADVVQVLTGVIIMSDWIASNPKGFPMRVTKKQEERVARGLEAAALTRPWEPRAAIDEDIESLYRRAFGWPENYSVRPVQRGAVEAARAVKGPCLTFVEAPTGEGKTEAGLAAAEVFASATEAQGIVFAAPTMSTANGLFNRVVDWAQHVVPENEISSMYLAHSKNRLSQDYTKLRPRQIGLDIDSQGSVIASDWLSGPKKGLLSNFVVGTVDQVLMLALQMKHSMLRHLALAGKVIIIDEVHAYDAYMNAYLQTALKWLARYGVSVILMSATLPIHTKNLLAEAYGSQLTREPVKCESSAYPLVTTVTRAGSVEKEIELGPTQAIIAMEFLDDGLEQLRQRLEQELIDGGCALVICNTIQRAQDAYQACKVAFGDDVELHHAAFIASERAEKEDKLRAKLGPDARRGSGRPHRLVVIATQVAEQSLDIDADLLITDIAPMDLVIQRMGRIHRHPRPDSDRPDNLRQPKTLIRGIVSHKPIPEWDSGASFIYGDKMLMATYVVLLDYLATSFRRPDDIAPAVHATYSDSPPIPLAWANEWQRACNEEEAKQSLAQTRAKTFRIPPPENAAELSSLFVRYVNPEAKELRGEEAGFAQVRDADPTIEVIPIIMGEYGYVPVDDADRAEIDTGAELDFATAWRLASATVRLPARFTREDWKFEKVISKLEEETPVGWRGHYLTKGAVALVLDHNRCVTLLDETLHYSHERGLEQVGEKKGAVS